MYRYVILPLALLALTVVVSGCADPTTTDAPDKAGTSVTAKTDGECTKCEGDCACSAPAACTACKDGETCTKCETSAAAKCSECKDGECKCEGDKAACTKCEGECKCEGDKAACTKCEGECKCEGDKAACTKCEGECKCEKPSEVKSETEEGEAK